MGLFTLFTSSFLKVGCSYCMYCIWKYYHYYHTVLGWCKVKQRQIYWFKNKNTLPDVGHIHAPIHHISLSCHWSSSQLHTECPTLGALRRNLLFCLPPVTFVFVPEDKDKLTPKPCFIPAPQAADDTSLK